ncbi:oligosaccharide flippase family protein [Priestia megaterium]|uniref:oligosaccharide flippase family protein n=1 Tax=Priestia megaterium TaxID=1404 RepID=UPI0012AA07F4|nr:oligosaccharide flippase family protein [Priestia megaterium]QFY72023.1 hypothetical protein CEQ83_05685 [Priestia megaterium]
MLILKKLFHQIKRNKIAKNTAWMLVGYLAKVGLQAVTFVFLAKQLGIREFGIFSSILAVSSIIAPFVHLGAYNMLIEDIVKGKQVSKAVGNNLVTSLIVLPLGLLLIGIISLYLKISIIISINVSIAVCLGGLLIGINKAVNISQETLRYNSYLEVLLGFLQILSVFVLNTFDGGILEWSTYYLICNLFVGTIALVTIIKRYGWVKGDLVNLKTRLNFGFHFAIAGLANNGLADIDKTMLTKVASLEATGVFSLAQRVINMGFLPLMAFLGAIYPRFVNIEARGYEKSRNLAIRITPIVLAYSIMMILIIWIFAPILVGIIGEGFKEAKIAIRTLCFLILIQGLQYPFADALTGSGNQKIRTYCQVSVLFLNIMMNLAFIPKLGWVGAAVGSIISQIFFLLLLLFTPILLKKNVKR